MKEDNIATSNVTRTRRKRICLLFASRLSKPKFLFSFIPACAVLLLLTYALYIGREYVKYGLLWLDDQEEWVVCVVFLILYTAVSFPLTWGYVLLNLACGYHYGLILGTLVTAIAASAGIVFAHLLMKHYFIGTITAKLLGPDVLRATVSALQSAHAFKLIAISRLTPIPFGLQNALFAVSMIYYLLSLKISVLWIALVQQALVPTRRLNDTMTQTVSLKFLGRGCSKASGALLLEHQIVVFWNLLQ